MYTLKCHKTNIDKWKWISLDQPRTHSVQGLSLSGFWLPEPERHSGAHCRSDISAGQSAACHPWTTLNRDTCREETRLEDGVDIQKKLQNWIKMKERRKHKEGIHTSLWAWGRFVLHRWTERPHRQQRWHSLFYLQNEEVLKETHDSVLCFRLFIIFHKKSVMKQ